MRSFRICSRTLPLSYKAFFILSHLPVICHSNNAFYMSSNFQTQRDSELVILTLKRLNPAL